MPGLTGNLIRVHDLEEYTTVLSRLVADEELRLSLGEATRRRIVEVHMGSNWQHNLEEVYTRAATLPRVKVTSSPMDQMFITEPDVFWIRDHSWNCELDDMIQPRLPIMPFEQRLYHWMRLAKKHGWQNQISLLLPEWFRLRYYLPLRSVLKMGNGQ
jgi:hypothetical protein